MSDVACKVSKRVVGLWGYRWCIRVGGGVHGTLKGRMMGRNSNITARSNFEADSDMSENDDHCTLAEAFKRGTSSRTIATTLFCSMPMRWSPIIGCRRYKKGTLAIVQGISVYIRSTKYKIVTLGEQKESQKWNRRRHSAIRTY